MKSIAIAIFLVLALCVADANAGGFAFSVGNQRSNFRSQNFRSQRFRQPVIIQRQSFGHGFGRQQFLVVPQQRFQVQQFRSFNHFQPQQQIIVDSHGRLLLIR